MKTLINELSSAVRLAFFRAKLRTIGCRAVSSALGVDAGEPMFQASVRRVGGLVFWRLGRLGGSLYISATAGRASRKLAEGRRAGDGPSYRAPRARPSTALPEPRNRASGELSRPSLADIIADGIRAGYRPFDGSAFGEPRPAPSKPRPASRKPRGPRSIEIGHRDEYVPVFVFTGEDIAR